MIIPERYRVRHDEGIKHFLKTGEGPVLGKTVDISAIKKSGEEFDVSLSVSPSKIDGETCFIGFIRDTSEKRAIEKQREFDKNNLNALINNTTDLMWSVDLNTRLITFNKPFFNLIKLWSGKEFTQGDDIFSAGFPPDQTSRFKSNYKRAFAGETFTTTEHTESVESWSEISYYPIRKGDEVIGVACHSHDITHRKKNEQNLKRSEKRLKEAQEIAHLGSWVLNFSTNKGTWSEECCKIYGLPKEECIQTHESWLAFIHPDDLKHVQGESKRSRKTLSDMALSHRIILKNGAIKHIFSKSKFELDKKGNAVGLYGIAHDVTARKHAEAEREKMTEDLIQRNKELEQFAYIISHNLRAPVANILGTTSLLNDTELSEEEKTIFRRGLNESVMGLDNVIKDLNHILETKRGINEIKGRVCLSELVNDIKMSIKNLIDTDHITIACDFKAIDELLTLKSYLYSIFYNLIFNSVKFRKPQVPCIITIKSQIIKNKIVLTFTDNGLGIDLQKQGDQIFGMYKRFHTNIEGKGMGLFMVKTQVETLGGKISVTSEVDSGTAFKIEFEL
ncbi:MAG: PAS domain S-box protein [Mucilaginibacter sp.]